MVKIKTLLSIILALLSFTALADESGRSNTRYTIKSFITMVHFQELETRLIASSSIKEIEFVDSYGVYMNEIEVTRKMIDLIDRYKLNTFARGNCAFACATIFLSGYRRTLLADNEGKVTRLFLRPVMSKDDEFLKDITEEFFTKIALRSEGKIPDDLLPWLFKVKDEFGGIRISSKPTETNRYIQFRNSANGAYQNISDLTPGDLGIIVAQ